MNPHLGDDAQEFGAVAAKAFGAAGGVELARRVEVDPALRATEVEPLLAQLGIGDLRAADDLASAEAAAALCREAGRVVLPYPVVPALLDHLTLRSRRNSSQPSGADESRWRVDHSSARDEWRVATIDGDVQTAASTGERLGTRLGPFVGDVTAVGPAEVTAIEIALHLTLTSFVVAGALRSAVDLATTHVVGRVQFDKPLSAFQAVQFQLADAHVAVAGLDEMNQFALWRCHVATGEAIVDALGARLAALDAARAVLRITQQLHGAAGVCDEYDVSVIARHLQPALRLPFGAESSASHLADAISELGFAGLFPHGGQGA